jgi:hypothetical protein
MGIKNPSVLVQYLSNSTCNMHPKNYKIIFDGEIIRHLGYNVKNQLSQHPEMAIAQTSISTVKNIVSRLSTLFDSMPSEVIVYFDGVRPSGKVVRVAPDFSANDKDQFSVYCHLSGYTVKQLLVGEAELMMYLERDKEMDLNIFVTSDTDVISIMYGGNYEQHVSQETVTIDQNNMSGKIRHVAKQNSVMWVRIRLESHLDLYGMDDLAAIFHLSPNHFRIAIVLTGTDYSLPIFTKTMMINCFSNIVNNKSYARSINQLTKLQDIIVAFIYLSAINKFSFQRNTKDFQHKPVDYRQFEKSILNYLNYIENSRTINIYYDYDRYTILKDYIEGMLKCKLEQFKTSLVTAQFQTMSMSEAISQYKSNRDMDTLELEKTEEAEEIKLLDEKEPSDEEKFTPEIKWSDTFTVKRRKVDDKELEPIKKKMFSSGILKKPTYKYTVV